MNQFVLIGKAVAANCVDNSIVVNVNDDELTVKVWDGLADKISGFVDKVIGVKGKLQNIDGVVKIIAETVSVLNAEGKTGDDDKE